MQMHQIRMQMQCKCIEIPCKCIANASALIKDKKENKKRNFPHTPYKEKK